MQPKQKPTIFQEHLSTDPDWRAGDYWDDLAAQFNRMAHTCGDFAEWHRSESRRKTQRGRERELQTSQARMRR